MPPEQTRTLPQLFAIRFSWNLQDFKIVVKTDVQAQNVQPKIFLPTLEIAFKIEQKYFLEIF